MGTRGYDLLWGSALRLTTRTHRLVHRLSGGRLWRRFPGGAQVVWVTTLGRRSGRWRTTPLLAAPHGDDWAVAGSNAGQAALPAWVHNMRANRAGYLEIEGASFAAEFTEVTDRTLAADLYRALAERWSAYTMYERHAGREIPVFLVKRGNPVAAVPGS